MKLKQWIVFLIVIALLWTVASLWIDNSIILPAPWEVLKQMVVQVQESDLYLSLGMTFFRVLLSVSLSSLFGMVLAFVSQRYKTFSLYFEQILLFLRSIPNVTFVILLLFWVNREASVYIVAFLLLFPIFYQSFYEAVQDINGLWKDVFSVYPQSFFTKLRLVYLPFLRPAIVSSWITCSSLGFKVIVMAEILTSVSWGIGTNMQYARLNVDLAGVMAWTIWLLICVSIFNKLLKKVLERLFG